MRKETTQIFLVALVIFITATLRVINAEAHLYNLVPVAALGLFSGSVLQNKRWAYAIPLAAMFLSDLGLALFTHIQGFYGISQVINYMALGIITFMGTRMQKRNVLNIAGYTLSGSLFFFLLSNFGTWLGGYYAYTFAGLTECFTMALPFYKSEMATSFFVNSVLGDLCFSGLAFGLFALLAEKRQLAPIN